MIKVRSITAMTLGLLIAASTAFAGQSCDEAYGHGSKEFSVAAGSPGEIGLIEALAKVFAADNDARVCWRDADSHQALKALREKTVDMVMTTAPAAEKTAVKEGWATQRTLIGSNEYFIVGPVTDPAGASGAATAADALLRIFNVEEKFFSRGDNSEANKREMQIWRQLSATPYGKWYIPVHDDMAAVLDQANKEKGYAMTDSSTWAMMKSDLPNLKLLFKGDKSLMNACHALRQPDGATPGAAMAAKFIGFMQSKPGQKIILIYGKSQYGEAVYDIAAHAAHYED